MAKNKKIIRFRKNGDPNIGIIIFGVIFVYLLICVVMYFRTSHIVRYEVKEGSLTSENIYRGIVLRQEEVVTADVAGYVNFYAREGERVAKNNLVYILDETGRLSQEMDESNLGENSLSDRELAEFRSDIVDFCHGFDVNHYASVYDIKFSLKNSILKLFHSNMLESIQNLGSSAGTNIINYFYAPTTGIVSYWTDGLEQLSISEITPDIMEAKDYQKNQVLGNSLLKSGDFIYKLTTSEKWSLVIPIDAARGAKLQEEGFIKVRFMKNQYESWGETKLITNTDGNSYLQLTFNNSMITFINDRFLDVELIVEDERGLKIPVSSIVQKEFFLIPEEFVSPGGINGGDSINKQKYMEDGTTSVESVNIEVYNFDSETGEYYVDNTFLDPGDILIKINGMETFTVSKRATLTGVYNMNKGYADFKQIKIMYQNEEYAIVRSNTKYGLNVYDYIVLNADSVKDDQMIQNRGGKND